MSNDILELLIKEFPNCNFKSGSFFDNNEKRLVLGTIESTLIDKAGLSSYAFDPYYIDIDETIYTAGVHKLLYEFVESKGYYWEFYDPETYFLYKI